MRSAVKKLCAVLLALIMVLALLPAAFADTDEPEVQSTAAEEPEAPDEPDFAEPEAPAEEPAEEPAEAFEESEEEPAEEFEELTEEFEEEPEEPEEPAEEPEEPAEELEEEPEEPAEEPEEPAEESVEPEEPAEESVEPEEPAEESVEPEDPAEEPAEESEEPAEEPEVDAQETTTRYVQTPSDWTSTPIDLGTTMTSLHSGNYRVYEFVPELTASYQFYSDYDGYLDTYCVLFDEDRNQLALNDSGRGDGQFMITYQLDAGETYYYCVSLYNRWSSATFPVVLLQVNAGWTQIGNKWYYYNVDAVLEKGLLSIDGKLYCFDIYDGHMLQDVAFENAGQAYYALQNGEVVTVGAGWNHLGEKWYYVRDGLYLKGHQFVDNAWYYFTGDYSMLSNNTDGEYVNELGRNCYYHAGTDGKLFINRWYQTTFGDWYYFGEDGTSCNGLMTIDGKQYWFIYDGTAALNMTEEIDGQLYYADSNGVLHLFQEGWNLVGQHYFYMHDGELYQNGIFTVGNALYGFDSGGWMFNNESFVLNDLYYRARDGGALYRGCWFESSYDTWFYYGPDGVAYTGEQTVNGRSYAFTSWGAMIANKPYTKELGSLAFAGDDGVLYTPREGWNLCGGKWYYVRDGELLKNTVIEIAGSRYGLDYDGIMYENDSFWWNGSYYRAKKGGKLYVNEWYTDEFEDKGEWYTAKYYYGADGAATGDTVQSIDGKLYCFWYDGEMKTNVSVEYEGVFYACGSSGELKPLQEGWNAVGNTWCYVENAQLICNCIKQIDGKYYGFNNDGMMIRNGLVYNAGRLGRARENGVLYTNQWFQANNGDWFYYGADAMPPDGYAVIGGKEYYFEYDGRMAAGKLVRDGEVYYLAGYDGTLTEVEADGWNRAGGNWYYIQDETLLKNGIFNIGSHLYCFDYLGRMYQDVEINLNGSHFRASPNGVLYVNSWYRSPLNEWYYYGDNGFALHGFKTVGGKQYCFDVDGRMLTGTVYADEGKSYLVGANGIAAIAKEGWNEIDHAWYYVNCGRLATGRCFINGTRYYFNQKGVMLRDFVTDYGYVFNNSGAQVLSGWYQLNGMWYYVNPLTEQYVTGSQKIGGKMYCFSDEGIMMTGEIFRNGKRYDYGTDGVLKSETKVTQNGWTLIDGVYYYYSGGSPFTGWVGSYYILRGVMLIDSVVDGCYVGVDGKIVKNDWAGDWGYAQENGSLACNEWLKLGNAWYYFRGYEAVCGIQIIDNKVYEFDENRKYVATLSSTVKNGWLKTKSNNWTYIYQGIVMRSDTLGLGSDFYGFDGYGLMIRNGFGDEWYNCRIYYFGADGKNVKYTGWQQISQQWYYFNPDYTLKTGMFTIGGKTYRCYNAMTTGWVVENKNCYHFGSSGAFDKKETGLDGWISRDGEWYYFRDGSCLIDGLYKIGGKTYGFTSEGTLAVNTPICSFFYERPTTQLGWYGGRRKTEWVGAFYFCGSDGALAKSAGWKTGADGSKYYTDVTGRCFTGIRKIDGKQYCFDSTGRLIG